MPARLDVRPRSVGGALSAVDGCVKLGGAAGVFDVVGRRSKDVSTSTWETEDGKMVELLSKIMPELESVKSMKTGDTIAIYLV